MVPRPGRFLEGSSWLRPHRRPQTVQPIPAPAAPFRIPRGPVAHLHLRHPRSRDHGPQPDRRHRSLDPAAAQLPVHRAQHGCTQSKKGSAARRVTVAPRRLRSARPPDRQGRETNAERAVPRVDNLSIPSPEPSTESAIRAPPGQERGHTRSLALFGGSAPGPPERGPDLLSGCPGHAEPALKGIPRLPAAPGQVAVSPASPPSRRR